METKVEEQQDIIIKQQEVIEGYKTLLEAQKNSKEALYNLLGVIHTSLKTNDPQMTEVAIKHLGKLLESKK
jgi:hypothetical protein